jgi:hypothetical protein
MRSFNANFVTEKNKRADGPSPINLLKLGFATPAYLSDRDITPSGGSAHQGLVKSWGFVDSSVQQTPGRGVLGTIEIADFSVVIANSESSRFSDNFTTADPPENVTVELYQWFDGLLYSEKELIFKGVVRGQPEYDLYDCRLVIKGIWEKYNKIIGEDLIISADDFPAADPDDIGKMQNIGYGTLTDVPCRCIESGSVDNLAADITAAATSIELSDASEMSSSGTIGIDEEEITYTGKSTNTLTGCTREANGTEAVTHAEGAAVWQVETRYVYQICGHPVKSIGNIYVDGFRVTSIATTYTGQSGNELSGHEGMAVFTVPSKLTRQQAVDLILDDSLSVDDTIDVTDTISVNDAIAVVDTIDVDDGISISDTIAVSDTIDVDDTIDVNDGIGVSDDISITTNYNTQDINPNGNTSSNTANPTYSYDGNPETYANMYHASLSSYHKVQFPSTSYGTIIKQEFWALLNGNGNDITVNELDGTSLGTVNPPSKSWFRFQSSDTGWSEGIWFAGSGGEQLMIYEVYKVVTYSGGGTTKTGGASKSGTVSKTGDATKTGSATKTGAASKSGAASKTGAASKSGSATKAGAATKDGTVTRSGAITLSGNSMADVRVGKVVVANIDGCQDDGSGTYTGTPSALIERPDHVFKHLWAVILGAPIGDIDSTTFTASGTFYNTNSYAFSVLISQPVQAPDLVLKLALQCRSRFFVTPYGTAKLIVRQLSQSSGHSIAKNEIKYNSMSVRRSAFDDMINLFNIRYDKDHSMAGNSSDNYRSVKNFKDATSISRYGQQEFKGSPDVFFFDAVTDSAMVDHVGAFLLAYHKLVRKMPNFAVFLDNCEIEPGDIIDITHDLDAMSGFVAEVQKIIHRLGSARRKQIDYMEIQTVEN